MATAANRGETPPAPPATIRDGQQLWRYRGLLLAGDLVSFLVFATLGRSNHSEAAGIAAPLATLTTAAPFIAAWLIVAPLAGAYGAATHAAGGTMARRTALAWLLAWPCALALRALIEQRGIPLSFAIVAGTVNMLFLLGWRSAFAYLNKRRR